MTTVRARRACTHGAGCTLVALLAPLCLSAQALPEWRTRLLALTDTNAMQGEFRVADGAPLAGATARGTLHDANGSIVWRGALGTATAARGDAVVRYAVRGLDVRRWSPSTPVRYWLHVTLDAGTAALRDSAHIGFRRVESARGRILLNGRPLFLRGNAINPPGRNIPDSLSGSPAFARAYMRALRRVGVNVIRLASASTLWLDAADDVGMLVFQGNYGTPRGGSATRPPVNVTASLAWYRDTVLAPQANHPSVIIYALTNETADPEIHYASDGAAAMGRFLQVVYDSVHAWDPTRLVIANAGYGFGRTGELCDLHRYWGWYYNSYLSFLTLRDPASCWRGRTGQPITLSEVVGNYTGADGRFNLVSDTKQPDSQLNWTGHAPDAEQGPRALAYQAWMAGQAIEMTRRQRAQNPNLAGVSPFTIVFGTWFGIRSMDDMAPKPVLAQYARSFSPVLLSWESWTSQQYAGDTLAVRAHIVNDADDGSVLRDARLLTTLRAPDGTVVASRLSAWLAVPYYGTASRAIRVAIPAGAATGTYTLQGTVLRGADTITQNQVTVRVHRREPVTPITTGRTLYVYDPAGGTRNALAVLGIAARPVRRLVTLDPARDALLVGREAWDASLSGQIGLLEQFIGRGGRVLVLDQRPDRFATHWLPGGVRPAILPLDHGNIMPGGRPWAQGMAVNPERPEHPVFEGLTRDDLFLWNDYSGWTTSTPGFPAVYPVTRGFALTRPQELWRVATLADYDHGLTGVALAEFFAGRGSSVLSAFDIVPRVGRDPVADRLLRNLVAYVRRDSAHDARPIITAPIVWGDYGSEQGIVTGIASGLLLNTVPTMPAALESANPVRIDEDGFWLAGEAGGWNTKPAVQYVARGRRPFGPYEFTAGGSYKLTEGAGTDGEGQAWWRAPAAHTTFACTVQNPVVEPLDVTVTVNGTTVQQRLAGRSTASVIVPLHAGTTAVPAAPFSTPGQPVAFRIRGNRRLVLLQSETR